MIAGILFFPATIPVCYSSRWRSIFKRREWYPTVSQKPVSNIFRNLEFDLNAGNAGRVWKNTGINANNENAGLKKCRNEINEIFPSFSYRRRQHLTVGNVRFLWIENRKPRTFDSKHTAYFNAAKHIRTSHAHVGASAMRRKP